MAENGWPIIVKRDAWKTASIVGFTSGKDSIFIDKGAKNWVARTLSKSMEVQDMPSCRGSGWPYYIYIHSYSLLSISEFVFDDIFPN